MSEVDLSRNPFNSPLETGVRSVGLLVAAFPESFDLQRLVVFDHLVVHTGDLDGPTSLHPNIPMRSAELLVRRGIVERGLLLMISRGLVDRQASNEGIFYRAGEFAETFLSSLTSAYLRELQDRANWVVNQFGTLSDPELKQITNHVFDRWLEVFQIIQAPIGGES